MVVNTLHEGYILSLIELLINDRLCLGRLMRHLQ